MEVMRKEIGDREALCCKDLTREIAIRYLKYVSVDCEGEYRGGMEYIKIQIKDEIIRTYV